MLSAQRNDPKRKSEDTEMAAIPKSNLPGHRQLHERAVAALERCQEAQGVDFKESAVWDELKWHVIHSVLGMGNLRDGGVIVIGVSQRGDQWDLTGLDSAHLGTYDVDVVTDQVNKYISPAVSLDVVLVQYNAKQFLAIHAREFEDAPLVCKKNGPEGNKAAEMLKEGAVFVRPPGMARTTRVTNADQMGELLQLAAEKRARRILEASRRIGMVAQDSDRDLFEQELRFLSDRGTKLPIAVTTVPHWRVNIRPEEYEAERIPSLSACFGLVEQTKVSLRGWDFPHLSHRDEERGHGNNWVASWTAFITEREYWRLYQSGQFVHLHAVEEAMNERWREQLRQAASSIPIDIDWSAVPGFISYLNLLYGVTEVFEFAARVCQRGVYTGGVRVGIELRGIQGYALMMDTSRFWRRFCVAGEQRLGKSWTFDSAELVAASAERSLDAAMWLLERFGWLSPPVEMVTKDQRAFLEGRS
jgi:Putative DNA-binding domain